MSTIITAFSLYTEEDAMIERMRRREEGSRLPSRSEIVRRAIRLLATHEGLLPSEE